MVLEVERFFRHPLLVSTQYNNDIALIRLKVSLEYCREVAPVCLPDTDISPGTVCVTTGWGLTQGGCNRKGHDSIPSYRGLVSRGLVSKTLAALSKLWQFRSLKIDCFFQMRY